MGKKRADLGSNRPNTVREPCVHAVPEFRWTLLGGASETTSEATSCFSSRVARRLSPIQTTPPEPRLRGEVAKRRWLIGGVVVLLATVLGLLGASGLPSSAPDASCAARLIFQGRVYEAIGIARGVSSRG
jgi:hypothetical protein